MRISPRGTLSTPPAVAITVGKNTPNASVTSFEPSPMPNQMMNSGTSAIFGIGNSADTTAIPGERSNDDKPTANAEREAERPCPRSIRSPAAPATH